MTIRIFQIFFFLNLAPLFTEKESSSLMEEVEKFVRDLVQKIRQHPDPRKITFLASKRLQKPFGV